MRSAVGDACVRRPKGYWLYELCLGSNATQRPSAPEDELAQTIELDARHARRADEEHVALPTEPIVRGPLPRDARPSAT